MKLAVVELECKDVATAHFGCVVQAAALVMFDTETKERHAMLLNAAEPLKDSLCTETIMLDFSDEQSLLQELVRVLDDTAPGAFLNGIRDVYLSDSNEVTTLFQKTAQVYAKYPPEAFPITQPRGTLFMYAPDHFCYSDHEIERRRRCHPLVRKYFDDMPVKNPPTLDDVAERLGLWRRVCKPGLFHPATVALHHAELLMDILEKLVVVDQ